MPRRLLNHLILYLENGKRVFISTETEATDSMLCRDGGFLMGKLWDKSKVKVAQTFITRFGANP